MAGSIAGFSVTQACLSDEEWEAHASQVGMGPAERQGLQCRMWELGGTGGNGGRDDSGEPRGRHHPLRSNDGLRARHGNQAAVRAHTGHGNPAATSGADQSGVYANATTATATTALQGEVPAPTKATQRATALVINVASVQPEIPEYDRGDWKHWADYDKDC